MPNIISAQEAKRNGVDLGEMQINMLKTIEELTLHIINQGKKIDALEIEVNSLKNKLVTTGLHLFWIYVLKFKRCKPDARLEISALPEIVTSDVLILRGMDWRLSKLLSNQYS